MKIVRIKGTMVVGRGLFSKGKTVNIDSMIAVSDDHCTNGVAGIIGSHPVFLSGAYFAEDGRFYIHLPHCTVVEATEAEEKEKSAFLERLDNANLYFGDDDKLYIKFPGKVKYKVGNQLLSREQVENLVLPEGKAFCYRWDNGYSYCGTQPATKDEWLKSADTILARHFFFGENGGVWISEASEYGECFAVDVCIGDNISHSEVSFS